ncbi:MULTISPECIES: hypothetical protein [unclassified Streptomyces]|uniref:hypothetical protein n=1 Tax=unclassified Streptomyces TaxID=2593676 RepID=UPI0022B61E21|nr:MULTISPECIES: hypothetical protein [unclassified Streptomyces]MCZ7414977.1 hypothetical protein [Streptomyces sp. WMMC897]MCZ7431920.1 hypothetical protein [Streptomyces sp. WMMC1477]
MNQAVRRIGRSLALVLPVVLVLSGTLAVARVPWSGAPSESQMLTASTERAASGRQEPRAPHEVLRDRLVAELQEKDPGVALTSLQRAVDEKPSLARHCVAIARALGQAAVQKYGSPQRAQRFARPVCDTSFASGVADFR